MPKFNIKDVRAVYVLVFGIVFIASIAPIALPLPVQQMVKDFYNVMTKGVTVSFASPPRVFTGVKAGTRVLIVNSGEISKLWGDMSESTTIVWRQLMNAGAHIFLWSADPGAQSILDSYLLPRFYGTNPKANALYGTQFVDLGYVAGGSGVLEAWRFDLKGLTPTDRYGTPIGNLPMMSNFNALKTDCDLLIGLDARSLETIFVVRDNTPVLEIGGTGSASYLALSYTGGYFKGCLFGQIAGAQYQVLSGLPGNALSYAEMMILLGTAMIIMMVVFNIRYRMNMGKEAPKQEAKK